MTSSTKPEVHIKLHYRQTGTEPRPQATYAENVMMSEGVVFEIREKTERQTYTLIAIFRILPVDEQSAIIMG